MEQRWREEPTLRLLAEPRTGWLRVAGCVANQVAFYDRFAAVVLRRRRRGGGAAGDRDLSRPRDDQGWAAWPSRPAERSDSFSRAS